MTDKCREEFEKWINVEHEGMESLKCSGHRHNLYPVWKAAWISAQPKWQPIETAPKDGTKVLACFEGQFEWIVFIAQYVKGYGLFAHGYAEPTHWMPLPQPLDGIE